MNRYAAEGIAADLLAGKRIMVLTDGSTAARAALDAVANTLPTEAVSVVIRANGREGIQLLNGADITIRAVHSKSALRGRSADVIYCDTLEAGRMLDMGDVRSVLAASSSGELIRA